MLFKFLLKKNICFTRRLSKGSLEFTIIANELMLIIAC